MTTIQQFTLSSGRVVTIASLADADRAGATSPFATLVPAFEDGARLEVEAVAPTLVAAGCTEFCCVGPEAELLHDALDDIIEERGALNVVTTWHGDDADACEYFLFGAGGGTPALLATIGRHPELVAQLKRTAHG